MKALIIIVALHLVIFVSATASYAESYWAKAYHYGGSSEPLAVQQTSDLGFIVAVQQFHQPDSEYRYHIVKLTDTGEISWDKVYSLATNNYGDYIYDIKQTDDDGDGEKDDGYLVAGSTDTPSGLKPNAWLIKLSSNGDIMWQKMYGGSYADELHSIEQTTDLGYIVAGFSNSDLSNTHPWVMKLDASGNIQWEKAYTSFFRGHAYSIQQTLDQAGNPTGYIVGGDAFNYDDDNSRDYLVMRLDTGGGVIWQKTFGGAGIDRNDDVHSVKQVFDQIGNPNGYIVAGVTWSLAVDVYTNWVLRLDDNGGIIWQKIYHTDLNERPGEIQPTADGGFILCGQTNGIDVGLVGLFTIKIRGDGSIEWQTGFQGAWDAQSIKQTFDQDGNPTGYISVGEHSQSDYDGLFVLKVDSGGNIPTILSCDRIVPATFSAVDTTVEAQSPEVIVTATTAIVTPTTISPQDVVVNEITTYCCYNDDDYECDGVPNDQDNCPEKPNGPDFGTCTEGRSYKIARPCVEDGYCGPTDGFCSMNQEDVDEDSIGDACDFCEGDFECDLDVDGTDAATFKSDFGRSQYIDPCTTENLCHGDFECDSDVDGTDAAFFKSDFGRGQYNDQCPPCEVGIWCVYP